MVNTREEKEKVRATKVGGKEIMWGLGHNFLPAPSQPFFSLATVGVINAASVGGDRLDPS